MDKQESFSDLNQSLSLGKRIQQFRLDLNLSYEQVFLETKISEQFIAALEREDWSQLPVYAYSRGLLQNLLEVYRVKEETRAEILQTFAVVIERFKEQSKERSVRNLAQVNPLAQEAPPPPSLEKEMEVNLGNTLSVIKRLPCDEEDFSSEEKRLQEKFFSSIWASITVVALFILLILSFFYFEDLKRWINSTASVSENFPENNQDGSTQRVYSLYSKFSTFDMVRNDLVKVFFNNRIFNFRLSDIINTFDNKVTANFDFNSERLIKVYLFEEVWVDIDEDGREDILIKFQKISGEVVIVFFSLINETQKEVNYESIWNNQEKMLIEKGEKVLLNNQSKTPIQVYIKATSLPVHLAYNIDGQRQNIVNLSPGNTVTLLAHDHMELQIGNFRSVNLILNFIPLIFKTENPNQFGITKIIKWLPSFRNETKYDLVIRDYIE